MGNHLSGPRTITPANGPPLAMPVNLPIELRSYWDAVAAQLPEGIATAHDQHLVVQLCQALWMQHEAWSKIVTDGIETFDDSHGKDEVRRNPAIITWRQASDMALQCMNLLGMSPISRKRIQADDGERVDPFLEFLRRRNGSAAQE